ncbi:unnamed protein product, partial [Sphacelaria rigidula]
MLTLVEVLGAELNKKSTMIFRHNVVGIVEGVIKTSSIAQEEPEDALLLLYSGISRDRPCHVISVARVAFCVSSRLRRGWQIFSLKYAVQSPITAVVHEKALANYRRVFHVLWRVKRVEWSLASAWRLHNSATHVRVERALPQLRAALHRCSLVRGQMVFLTTNLSNYMMFEVLETSWGTLQEQLDSAHTLDDIINAHDAYLSNILERALLRDDSLHVLDKLLKV